MDKKKTNKAPRPLNYVMGTPVDARTVPGIIKYALSTFGLMVAFLLFGTMMMWKNVFLRLALNGGLLLFGYLLYWQAGLSSGTVAVNKGEIFYQREQTGRETSEKERQEAYHPMKGFIVSLLGSIPMFLIAVGLALTAQRVMASAGVLPGWLETLERRDEIGGALQSYHQAAGMSVTDALRLMVRMALMPLVNIIGAENKDALLILERVSPLLMLLPAVFYGVGYQGGVRARSKIHSDIEAGKRKMRRRQKRERQQRTGKGPEQLN